VPSAAQMCSRSTLLAKIFSSCTNISPPPPPGPAPAAQAREGHRGGRAGGAGAGPGRRALLRWAAAAAAPPRLPSARQPRHSPPLE
jgi:hypothetical protein